MKNIKRVFLIVLDSVGIGNAKDAKEYNDLNANTLKSLYDNYDLKMPNMESLGIKNLINDDYKSSFKAVIAKANEKAKGKDSVTGHWEMMGCILEKPFNIFTENGLPKELISELEKRTNTKVLGGQEANGIKIIKEYKKEHELTKKPIVYTSVDSTFQIAANEDVIDIKTLYHMCEIARELTKKDKWKLARVIARPYKNSSDYKDGFYRTENRRDYALDPFTKTHLDYLKDNNIKVISIGKIKDLFNNNGISKSISTKNNKKGQEAIINLINDSSFSKGLAFANLVDFDSIYGHPRDPLGYKNALEEWDKDLKVILDSLKEDDLLILTSDHGNDPTFKGNDHTREQVFMMAYNKNIKAKKINDLDSFANIGKTICDIFNVPTKAKGTSFKNELQFTN